MERNNFIYVVVALLITLLFSSCDTYRGRKKLVAEFSSLYNENQAEFDLITDYFLEDSIPKFFTLEDRDYKIELKIGNDISVFDSIDQVKDNRIVFIILKFMQERRIRTIYGYGNGNIGISFEDFRAPCFHFEYRSDFDPNDEGVKEQIKWIRDTKKKAWMYVLDNKGWYIQGVPCFS